MNSNQHIPRYHTPAPHSLLERLAPVALPTVLLVLFMALTGCSSEKGASHATFSTPATAKPMPPDAILTASVTNQIDPAWLRPGTNAFILGPGDKLDIELVGETTNQLTVVSPDGKIYFNVLPGVDVWGLTIPQAKARVEQALGQYVRNNPRVALSLRSVQSQRVWLLGRVNKPGVYPLSGPTTILEAISQAGGPASPLMLAAAGGEGGPTLSLSSSSDELADLHRAILVRHGHLVPIDFDRLMHQGDLSQNIYLQPDDFIYVPSSGGRDVYVIGAVSQPRAVSYSDNLTLIRAIANAGGTVKDAYLSHVAIVRGSFNQPQISVIDMKDIVHARATDVQVEPGDIIYVPYTPYRVLARYVDLILNTFASTVGANEGARVIDPNATGLGQSISVGGSSGVGISVPVGNSP